MLESCQIRVRSRLPNLWDLSGGADRGGIWETDNVSDPVSLTLNTFDGSLLTGTGTSAFYRDQTANVTTWITDIDQVNALDEDGLNPSGTASGNQTSSF